MSTFKNDPVAPILVRSKTYHWPGLKADPAFKYSRGSNPTRKQLEDTLSLLEHYYESVHTTVFSSGLGAEAAFLLSLCPGDRVLLGDEIYGGTYRLFHSILHRFGIHCDFTNFNNYEEAKKAIRPETKYLFVEPLSNPSLIVTNLENVARLSKETGIPFVLDATFTPPCTFKSFDYGAETVIHSLSKYISGHNDVLGGSVTTKNKALHEKLKLQQSTLGAVLSPDECYRVLQGLKTLPLRWERVSKTALAVGQWLEEKKKEGIVKRVLYPELSSHPQHELAQKQFTKSSGSVISFELATEDTRKLEAFVDTIIKDGRIIFGESLASPETILSYPPLMSHKSLPKEERLALGISDGFFRLSVGFDEPKEIIASLEAGFKTL